jgi:hypothetical protein
VAILLVEVSATIAAHTHFVRIVDLTAADAAAIFGCIDD